MIDNYILVDTILRESSAIAAVNANQKSLRGCSSKCRRITADGPNYDYQVKVCTSACKIRSYNKMLIALRGLKAVTQTKRFKGGAALTDDIINSKISYYVTQLNKEKMKYKMYREQLKKRQTTIPVDMSLKPSPERWDPKKLN